MSVADLADPNNIKLPFGVGAYEPVLMMSVLDTKTININTLSNVRSKFVDIYFKNGYDKKYPNALFGFQKQIKDAGHIDAYSHWLLMKGDETGFTQWQSANKGKWDNFITWFINNGIQINEYNKFYRRQY